MRPPQVTVLQLDTAFPRVAGDVGCADSYAAVPQIIRVPGASVGRIVTGRPQDIDIGPFEDALKNARGDLIVTSCGFLAYWQAHLAGLCDRPFISSSLTALDRLAHIYRPEQIAIVTFDAARLNATHLGRHSAYTHSIVGLPPDSHLRDVIGNDRDVLDVRRARSEMRLFIERIQTPEHRHIVLECTNLPPYRAEIKAATGLPVTDILTRIEDIAPGAVAPRFRL